MWKLLKQNGQLLEEEKEKETEVKSLRKKLRQKKEGPGAGSEGARRG